MRSVIAVSIFMVAWTAVTCFALLFGFNYTLPDFVHVDYGLPLTWTTYTLSTIAGPANTWNVSISNLLADLIFWLAIMAAISSVIIWKLEA